MPTVQFDLTADEWRLLQARCERLGYANIRAWLEREALNESIRERCVDGLGAVGGSDVADEFERQVRAFKAWGADPPWKNREPLPLETATK